MILTTTNSVEGKTISKYLGLVNCSEEYTADTIKRSIEKMEKQAKYLGADAVVGIRIATHNDDGFCAYDIIGTAVKFK